MLFMSDLNLLDYISPFDLDVAHTEECNFHVMRVILTKRCPEQHCNMPSNVKQDFIDYSEANSFKKTVEKKNKSLATTLVTMRKFPHFHL